MKAGIFFIVLLCVSIVTAQTKSVSYDFKLTTGSQKCMSCDVDPMTELLYAVQTKDIGLKGVYDLSYIIKSIHIKL